MSNPKDPEVAKLASTVARLEKNMQIMVMRILALEKENKRLRGAVGRASDQIGTVERRLPKA